MVTMETSLEVPENVASEVLDGEAILIHLDSGTYCSMDKVGTGIWERIAGGSSPGEIASFLTSRYDVAPDQAQRDVLDFVGRLVEEGLITVGEARPAGAPPSDMASSEPRAPYAPPELEVYDDMRHLLAIDPPTPGLENIIWPQEDGATEN
ncbi:PqqD family protein [Verrucomicrobiota bacterium]